MHSHFFDETFFKSFLGKRFLLSAFLLLLFSASCQALAVESPATIIVQQEQRDVLVTIRNDSSLEQDYSVGFSGPFDAFASPSFGKIGAGKSAFVTLSVFPNELLAGSTYEGVLEVEIGEEKAFRNVSVVFKEEVPQGNGGNKANAFSFAGFASLVGSLFSLENAVNFVLVVIAAVLLIAFIARFVRRVNS